MSVRSPLKSLEGKNNSLDSSTDTCKPPQLDSGIGSCSSGEKSLSGSFKENLEPEFLERSTKVELSSENSSINCLKGKSTRKQTRPTKRQDTMVNSAAAASPDRAEVNNGDVQDISKQPPELFFKQGDDGDTQLHVSILTKHVGASMWLIEKSPDPSFLDILNDDHHTALHLAVLCREPRIVQKLLLAGAKAELTTRNGNTALQLACSIGDLDCVKALIEPAPFNPVRNALLNNAAGTPNAPRLQQQHILELRNNLGETCLHIAASKGHKDLVIQLVNSGANLEAKDGLGGRTALHIAVELRHHKVAHFLAEQGPPSINAMNYAGLTAYQLACANEDHKLKDHLLRHGASPTVGRSNDDSDGSSASDSESSCEDDVTDVSKQDAIFSSIVLDRPVTTLVN